MLTVTPWGRALSLGPTALSERSGNIRSPCAPRPTNNARPDMRAAGMSLRQIAAELGVALSSASVWTRDVAIPASRLADHAQRAPEASATSRRDRSAYFRKRGDLHTRQTYEARQRRRKTARAYVVLLLEVCACADCGLKDPAVLDFDHVSAKRGDVAELVTHGYAMHRIVEEIENCEIVA